MRLFFLTIPKPLNQHPLLKKTIHSALPSGLETLWVGSGGVGSPTRRLTLKDLEEKLPDGSINKVNTFLVEKCQEFCMVMN